MATERREARERSPDRTSRSLSASPSSPTRTRRTPGDQLRGATEQARRFQQTELQNLVVQQGQMMQQQQAALQQVIAKLNEISSGQQQRDAELLTIRRQLDEARAATMVPPGLTSTGGPVSPNGQSDPFAQLDPLFVPPANGQTSQPSALTGNGTLPDLFQQQGQASGPSANGPGQFSEDSDHNPFKRSERWMPPLPQCNHQQWKKRTEEVFGFIAYCHDLATWVNFGSDEFGKEVLYAVRQDSEILTSSLSKAQNTRAIRLMSILKAAFHGHSRASLIISNYEEKRFRIDTCGFEALRLLAREFCVKTRTELLFFRENVTKGSFKGDSIPETVRLIQNKLFEYFRILEMVDKSVNVANLTINEADQCLVLLRSLPTQCRQWLVFNVVHEDFESYVDAALKYESQLRAWNELEAKPISPFNENGKGKGKDKGKGKNDGKETRTCFECNERGHLAADCPNKKGNKKGNDKGKAKGKGKDGKGKQNGKGKDRKGDGKGKSKKGKGKGKRATETLSETGEQPEDYPDEWSEIDAEDGGRLSAFAFQPAQPRQQHVQFGFAHVKYFLRFVVQFLALVSIFLWYHKFPFQAKPFLSQIQMTGMEPNYWLVDTGASRTVISDDAVKMYKVLRERRLDEPLVFYTANAAEVRIDKEVFIEVVFKVIDFKGKSKLQRFELRAAVGPVQHNLIGVAQMVRTGASLHYDHDGCKIFVSETSHIDCSIWCGVPWIEAKISKPRQKNYDDFISSEGGSQDDMQLDSTVFSEASPCSPKSDAKSRDKFSSAPTSPASTSSSRSVLKQAIRFNEEVEYAKTNEFLKPAVDLQHDEQPVEIDDLEMPEAPNLEGVSADDDPGGDHELPLPGPQPDERSSEHGDESEEAVHDYRKLRKRDHVELELHRRRGHFPFDVRCEECRLSKGVTQHRRVVTKKNEPVIQADIFYVDQHRYIVLAEAVSGLVGVSYVHGSSDKTTSNVRAFFNDLGFSHLTSSSIAIEVKTDAEVAVGQIVTRAQQGVKVVKAAPQAHASIGLAERSVRKLTEGAACIRADMRFHGFDICVENPLAWEALFDYIAQCNNYFNVSGDEISNRRSPIQVITQRDSAMPLCAVFGSIVHAKVPDSLLSEVAEGTRFVPAAYRRLSHGQMSHDVVSCLNGNIVHFKAEIKILNKSVWNPEFWPDVLMTVQATSQGDIPEVPSELPNVADQGAAPKTGPPISWVRVHGPTPGCQACVRRHGRVHSSACRKRYKDFLEQERLKLQGQPGPSDTSLSQPIENPETHPTRGYRVVGKRSPTEIEIFHDERVQDVELPDIMDVEDEGGVLDDDAAGHLDDDAMQVGKFALQTTLTDLPGNSIDVDTRRHGIVFPMYCPKKDDPITTEKFSLCGRDVYLVDPVGAVSECGMTSFSVEQAREGRKVELLAMDKLHIGEIMDGQTAQKRAQELNVKVIPCRWVITEKTAEGQVVCRARCVAQQVASREASASSLGISSNTPSCETFRCILAIASSENLWLGTLDISTAFLHSKLPSGIRAIVRLPANITMSAHVYDAVYMDLFSAMNGLRVASKAWMQLASAILTGLGLKACPSDPCLFCGRLEDGTGVVALLYVDDILIGAQSPDAIYAVKDAFERHVKTKLTGILSNDSGDGGSLVFLGRTLKRGKGERNVSMRVHPSYLQSIFDEFDVKPSETPPNIATDLEKKDGTPLSDEAANRYRRILGRIAWWAQTRVDHARFISMLSVGQAIPTEFHEAAMRRYLRFLRSCCHKSQMFPTQYEYSVNPEEPWGLVAVSDASWGSTTTRHSVSGGTVFWLGSLVKAYSRVQKSITLSSCESEVIGICGLMQECLGLRHVTEFLSKYDSDDLEEFVKIHPQSPTDYEEIDPGTSILCYTDSSSGIAVLKNEGLSRRVRHVNIAVAYVQQLVQLGHVLIMWMSTAVCCSDTLTKILARELWNKHSQAMGFVECDDPETFQLEATRNSKKNEPNYAKKIQSQSAVFHLKGAELNPVEDAFRDIRNILQECLNNSDVTHVIVDCCTSGRAGFSQVCNKFPGLRVV